MARCYICDTELTEVEFDPDLSIRPCHTCLEAIDESLEEFEDEGVSNENC